MATEMKVWQVSEGKLDPIEDTDFAKNRLEKDLESWIEKSPNILGDDLLIIDRQRIIEGIGRLDLLGIDGTGKLVIVELKRDLTPREAVAQALDYASWLNSVEEDDILWFAAEYLGQPLPEAFEEHFEEELPPIDCQNHRIILATPRLDASAERIINYLATRYGMDVNAVFFKYAKLSNDREILVRSVLVPDEIKKPSRRSTRPELLAVEKLYNESTPQDIQAKGQASNYRLIIPDDWVKKSYCYLFEQGAGRMRVQVHIGHKETPESVKLLTRVLEPLEGKSVASGQKLEWDKKPRTKFLGRLYADFPLTTPPETIAQGMRDLISMTRTALGEKIQILDAEKIQILDAKEAAATQ